MKTIFFQWWKGPSGQEFVTLHKSRGHARRFRREAAVRKWKGSWKSRLCSPIKTRDVSNRVHSRITKKLGDRTGVRAFISDFDDR